MNALRILVLISAGVLSSSFLRADVNVSNNTPCTTLKVMIKQYIFTDGNLGSCPAWEASVAYGATLTITDYFQSWYAPDQWGYPQYHSYEVRYEAQYTYHISAPCPPSCPEVASVFAKDTNHPGRVASTGGTLYLVGENSATISATSAGGAFGQNCPQWSGGHTGTGPEFINTSASNASFTAGGKTVNVVRMQAESVTVSTPPFMNGNSSFFNLGGKIPAVGASLKFKFNMGSTSFTGSKTELYNDPGWGVKVQYNLNVGIAGEGRVTHPALSWYAPPGSSNPWLAAEVALSLSGNAQITGSGGYDPSKAQPYEGSVTLNGSLTLAAQVFAYADLPWVHAEAQGSVSAGVSMSGRLSGGDIQTNLSWSGVVLSGYAKVYTDPNDPWVNVTLSHNLWDGDSSGWLTIYTIPTS